MTRLKSILITGFIAGTLDILAAILIFSILLNKVKAIILLQGIASGVFGKSAFEGGMMMAILGLIFHYFIATSFSVIYFLVYPKLKITHVHPIILGTIYGILIWCVMNLLVLPLSNVTPSSIKLIPAIRGIAILILCVGVPISTMAHRYSKSLKKN
ncbi:MAG: DUF1440 domain-containing protein [Cyclobacteriaceae bacterium]